MIRPRNLVHLAIASTFLTWLPATFARTITLNLEFTKLQYSALNPNYPGDTYYTIGVLVSSDSQPLTYDEVDSPAPNTSFSGTETGYGEYLFNDMGSALANVTNGVWTLTVNKGDPSQQQYTFTVSVNGLTNGSFPQVQITEPADGSTGVSTNTAFTWTGPDDWDAAGLLDHSLDYSFYAPATFSPPVNSWQNPPNPILGTNEFEVTYTLSATPWVTISTPVDSQNQPISSWMSGANLSDFAQSLFVATTNPTATVVVGGHTLFAHYAFTNDSSTFDLGDDSSPAGNGMNDSYSYWGPVHVASANAVVNGSAVQFFGTSCMTPDDIVLANYDNLLAGSFSFSAWIETTDSVGNDSDDAISGASIFWAYDDHNGTNDAIPLAITGDDAAFSVRDHLGNTTTIHSTTAVDDGAYHLVTVTRDQVSGLMCLYVDGQIQASTVGPTDPLNGNNYFLSIGGTTLSSYTGLLDDMQVYSGVLSASDVAALYANPGTTIPDTAAPSDGLAAHYDFSEGTVLAPDVSGNGNNIVFAGDFGGNGPVISTNAIGELGSVYFDGGSFLSAPTNLLTTLEGDFSISLWLNTTQDVDYAGDLAYNGAGVISAYIPNEVTNDLVPIALTGGQVAFNTESTYDDTLTSMASVNDGSWHHVVVCRNQLTGEKDIYVDGELDTTDIDTTVLFNAPQLLTIGAIADASNPDPGSPQSTGYNGYQGYLDDIEIYNRVLGSNDVAFLYAHPGITAGGTVTVLPPSPALLGNLSVAAGGIEFSFQTMSSYSYTVQSTTNLLTGSWINLTNLAGDGTVKQFTFPTTNSPTQFFRVETQ
ncbi:MAG TPA: LamG domain-containing protein [Candidatus Sulfotelmatobacter sp.]|nr:LamG domain-containing protein [Candidatus Sulfotelmatobacter sp.]